MAGCQPTPCTNHNHRRNEQVIFMQCAGSKRPQWHYSKIGCRRMSSLKTKECLSLNNKERHALWDFDRLPSAMYVFKNEISISSRIAGQGELSSSDFQACAQSPRWATRCSLGSVSCSCDAAPRTAVCKRALPVASSPLSEQRKTWSIFATQIEIFQVKAWLATFKARNANLNLLDDDLEKEKKLDRPAEGVHVRLRRLIVHVLSLGRCRSLSKSVVFGFS